MADFHRFESEPLCDVVREIVRGFGSDAREVDLVSENLVRANLYGHDSHGIGMLPRYVEAYLEGSLKPNAQPRIRIDQGPMLALDGQTGFGQSIGHAAMAMGIERAREHGTCIMALGNAHHLGRIGEWAEMAVAAGLVSVHFVNVISRPLVAAWGGRDARLGTNPFAIGIPIEGREPFILDLATSVIAQGKARVAYNKGVPLAPGQLLDHEGRSTTNPAHAVVGPLGALLPFGEHKGFGLSLACEILGGALAAGLAVHGPDEGKKRVLNGMLTILIDPARLGDAQGFAEQTLACLDWVTASPPQDGVEAVMLAGEPERRACTERRAHGIPVDGATWSAILAAADKLGVEVDRSTRHVGGLSAEA
ncbi:malate/lactate/ureidoglycolate dehydrogenase [Verticiella sediminum]|uniref:Malate/lactate/ureidoglycolate dehydrogenase n=1 Tax=Verticiella sediminum TaxID=1247510 RepID=A0A556AKD4_9BURK|nr:malate/lactate/ureidoglycolate dehydrogenase [Verticiella sediminum]TSH93357.1 malate/lactate/ureidoglycolate dehydrogenase [Verticiella sediminum]